jgi:hypothetical protein
MLSSPAQAIELLGGPLPVSAHLKRRYTTVSSWASRQSIPPEVWPRLVDMAQAKKVGEITYESLALAHASQAEKVSAA